MIKIFNVLFKRKIRSCIVCDDFFYRTSDKRCCSLKCSKKLRSLYPKIDHAVRKVCPVCRNEYDRLNKNTLRRYCSKRCLDKLDKEFRAHQYQLSRVYLPSISRTQFIQHQWETGAWVKEEVSAINTNKDFDLADIMDDVFNGKLSINIDYYDFLQEKGLEESDIDRSTFEATIERIRKLI